MVSIDRPLNTLHFRRFKKNYLKDPGSLNSKKRFCVAKQLYVWRHTIKGRPGLKTGKKQNHGAPYLLILHSSGCRRLKVKLFF